MIKYFYSAISLLVLTFAIGIASPSYAQESDANPIAKITLKITFPNGSQAIASAFEGENISVTDAKAKIGFVFVPTVLDEKTHTVEVKVFQVADGKVVESASESLTVAMDSPKDTQSSFKVELKAISRHLLN